MGRTLFQCLVPGCDSTPSKKHNVERHVWLQHVRKWMNCRTQEYNVTVHKRYVESYVGRHHSSGNSELLTPPHTPDTVSECGEHSVPVSAANTPRIGSPLVSASSTPTMTKFPTNPSFDNYLAELAANEGKTTNAKEATDDVTAAQQLALLSQQQHARAQNAEWQAGNQYTNPYGYYQPSFQCPPGFPAPQQQGYPQAPPQPRSGLDELAFAACEISRVAAMVGVGPDTLSLDKRHWRPW